MFHSRSLGLAATGALLGSMWAAACGDDAGDGGLFGANGGTGGLAEASVGGTGGSTVGGASGSSGLPGSGGLDAANDQSAGGAGNLDGNTVDVTEAGSSCELQKYDAKLVANPVDVIFAVDNSCSMAEEMLAIQTNINTNFAQLIASTGVDYRIILIGEHGSPQYPTNYESSLCIDPPLSGAPCAGQIPANTPPTNNPPIFYHYDHDDIESNDMWSKMLNWYDEPDRYNLLPSGWKAVLRTNAFKIFVGFSDDRIYDSGGVGFLYNDGSNASGAQAVALKFDTDITTLDSTQFGTPTNRNFRYHAVVGITPNPATASGGYPPSDPLVTVDCPTAVNVGWGHQGLAMLTGGQRFPVCDGQSFAAAFPEIAKDVIQSAKIACDFSIPVAPAGHELDLASIFLEYTPTGSTSTTTFNQVADATQCTPGGFYIEGTSIRLCPDSCSVVQGDLSALLQILALCTSG